MSEATERLLVRIDATTEQLRRELKRADDAVAGSSTKINKALDGIKKSFTGLGAIIGAAGLGLAFSKVIKNTSEQERVTSQLNATLNSTQFAAGKTADELIGTAASLQKVTRFGDEAIIGMQSLLLTFKDIKGDNFDRTTKAVLDMSTAMGQDLKSSALQLGKALNDPIGQLGALSRTGVTFSDAQKDLIKNLAETGRVAEAQVVILQELESQFGGSAEAARNTLAGALEGLGNAFDDLFEAQGSALGPMKESLNELEKILSDPRVVESLQKMTSALIDMGAAAMSALPTVVDFLHFIAMSTGLADSNIPKMEGELYELEKRLNTLEKAGRGSGRAANILRNEIKELEGQLSTAYKEQEKMNKASAASAKAAESASKAIDKNNEAMKVSVKLSKELEKQITEIGKAQKKSLAQHEKNTKSLEASYEAIDDMVRAGEEYIEQQEFEIALIKMSAKEQAIANAVRSAGTQITAEMTEKIKANAAALYEAEAATAQASEAARKMEEVWSASRSTLSDFFFEFARDGKNAFDTLVDGFKAMIAKMIAEAAANRIILGIGAAAGGMGFSGVASAASGLAGSGSGLTSMLSPMSGSVLGQYNPFYTNTGLQNAVVGDGGAALTPQFSWANAGAGLVGGLAGSYLGNEVFGPTSGLGSAAGSIGGMALASSFLPALGPWGIGAGALLGAFGGSGLESLFGGKNNGDNKGRANINLGTGAADVFGVGKSFNQANVDALQQLVPSLQQIAMALGGSNAVLDVAMGNNSGLSLNGKSFGKDEAGFIAAAIEAMVDGATGLSKTLKTLIQGFDGTSEELIQFATSLVSIDKLISENPVDRAVRDFADAQNLAARNLSTVYDKQIKEIERLTFNFDGSASAASSLNTALAINSQLAYDMAMAMSAIGASTKDAVKSQVDYFREQTRTPDESLQAMERQYARLFEALPNIKNPENIEKVTNRLLDLNQKIFDAGPEDLQRANVQTYIDAAKAIGAASDTALEAAIGNLQTTQTDINAQVGAMLEVSAQGFQASSDKMMSAAEMMYMAVQSFINGGGQYNQVVA